MKKIYKNKNKILLNLLQRYQVCYIYENKILITKISTKFFMDIELENWQLHKHETIP